MKNLALDTSAYTALGRGNKPLGKLLTQTPQIGLPITVLGEIHFGSMNSKYKNINNHLLENFLSNSRVEILHIDEMTAKLYGEIATELRRIGRPIQQNDIWIAALCKQYDYKLATDDGGFDNILGLDLVKFKVHV